MSEGRIRGDAVLSADGRYRYHLSRVWGSGPGVVFVLLNPLMLHRVLVPQRWDPVAIPG